MFRKNAIGIARHKKDFHVRPLFQKLLSKLAAIHIGHDDVGEKQMDWGVVILGEADGFQGVRSRQDLIAVAFQEIAGDFRKKPWNLRRAG